MGRVVVVLVLLGLIVYSFLDCVQTPPSRIRVLPKPLWLLAIVAVPVIGAAGWLLAGRPVEPSSAIRRSSAKSRPVAPDDDPEFLREIGRRTPPRQPQPDDPDVAGRGDDDEPEDKLRP